MQGRKQSNKFEQHQHIKAVSPERWDPPPPPPFITSSQTRPSYCSDKMSHFPPELIHHVVDFLADDRQTLYNSALTSSSFLHPSRRHIFRQILLRSSSGQCRPARRFLDFLSTAPHLATYITSLRVMIGQYRASISEDWIGGWIHEDDALPVVFSLLTRLQELSIESTNSPLKWQNVPLDLQNAVVEVIGGTTLSRLSLIQVVDFPILPLRISSSLKNIVLHCVTLTDSKIESSLLYPSAGAFSPLEGLHIVEARDTNFSDIHSWIHNGESTSLHLSCLKRLSLTIYGRWMSYSDDMAVVSKLLDVCSPTLEQLKLTPPLTFACLSDLANHPFHLATMPKLRKLEFGLEISDFEDMETSLSLSWLTELFSNLPTCNVIEDIVLKCEILQANPLGEFDHGIWTKIDKALTCKELSSLRHVTLILYPVHSEAKKHATIATELLQQEMKILCRRNILQIEKRYDSNRFKILE
ncbi:hypothetical protein BDN70DRAFT_451240 [Pholiota conissans]|uniref:F-box domain-containing protein n=1 Tax=Pholiota conissans TaxID=109636 RepID=A0A9P5Z5Z5_9AGAR|nr:hypothetical protein BDN70DRAFT_451240 [Pholiota conissans]